MDVGEDVMIWVITAIIFFIAVATIIAGTSAIKLKVNTMQKEIMDGLYMEHFSSINEVPSNPISESFDCRTHASASIRTLYKPVMYLQSNLPEGPWRENCYWQMNVYVSSGGGNVVSLYPCFYRWQGLCNVLYSRISGKESVDCRCESIRFYGDGRECVSVGNAYACAMTDSDVEDRGFLGVNGRIYATYSGGRIMLEVS